MGVESKRGSFVDVDPDSDGVESWDYVHDALDAVTHEQAAAVITGEVQNDAPRSELYDSGTTRHITPFRDEMTNFVKIPPRSFSAANKSGFSAVGMGDLVVDVPNGVDTSKLQLTEVLYSPEVGYTLISIGRLDDAGYTTTFSNGTCMMHGPDGEKIGEVPKNGRGLYRVVREHESANAADEKLTVMGLHRRMGHIAPSIARKLVEKGFVTGCG